MNGGFSASLRVLSSVPRWGIVRVIHRQSVADHSYYTAVYADEIGSLVGLSMEQRGVLMRAALWHDADEIVSGDIPGPVKREIPRREIWMGYLDAQTQRHFGGDYPRVPDDLKWILTLANLFDECAYLIGEVMYGNCHATHALGLSERRLRSLWAQHGLSMKIVDQFLLDHHAFTPLPGEE